MEKSETRDFMNVDSFSQLPFIRPAPAKDKAPVRLFGIEVQNPTEGAAESNNSHTSDDDVIHIKDITSTTTVTTTTTAATTSDTQSNTSGNGRKFECHYCCRNFPTSQALGGHQNAHKRERQHAKRAYLQSAAMLHPSSTADHHHHQLYGGILGYHHPRLGPTHLPYYPPSSSSSSSSWMSNSFTSTNHNNTLNRYYPSSSTSTSSYHSYPSHHHHHHPPPPPITGSPLAMWRIPASGSSNRDRSLLQQQYPPPPHPPHHHHHQYPPLVPLVGSSGSALIGDDRSKASHYLLDQAKKGLQDHVSLDLHL